MIYIRDSYRAPGLPLVTWWLLAINLLSFVAAKYGQHHTLADITYMGGLLPAEYDRPELVPARYLAYRQMGGLIPLVWYQFLHYGWFHLISNSAALFIFGPNVEMYMGRARFLMFYITCGCVGGMAQVLVDLDSVKFVIGASGAVSALFGAYFSVFPSNYIRITVGNIKKGAYRDLMIPVKMILLFWIGSQIFDAFLPAEDERQKLAYFSHFGGFIAGFLLAKGKGGATTARRNFKVFWGGKSRGNF